MTATPSPSAAADAEQRVDVPLAAIAGAASTPRMVSQLQLREANVIEQTPDEDGVERPTVGLVLQGMTAWGPQVIVCAMAPEAAVALGQGLAESGRDLQGTADKVQVVASMQQAEQIARAANAADALRAK